MIKHNRRILAVALAAVSFSGAATAQQPVAGLNTVAPGVVARAPAAAPMGALGAPSGPALGAPIGMGSTVSALPPAGGVFAQPGMDAGQGSEPMARPDRVSLKDTNRIRAQTELLRAQLEHAKLEAELRKAQDAVKASDAAEQAASLQSQLEAAKASDPKAAAAPAPEPEPQVSLVMTYGLEGKRYAEIRVGESLDTYMVGDKLSTGHVIKSIENGSMTVAKGKGKRAKPEVMRISRSAAQEAYPVRAAAEPAAAAPAALPAMGNGGQSVLNQLMRQNGIPPLPRQ